MNPDTIQPASGDSSYLVGFSPRPLPRRGSRKRSRPHRFGTDYEFSPFSEMHNGEMSETMLLNLPTYQSRRGVPQSRGRGRPRQPARGRRSERAVSSSVFDFPSESQSSPNEHQNVRVKPEIHVSSSPESSQIGANSSYSAVDGDSQSSRPGQSQPCGDRSPADPRLKADIDTTSSRHEFRNSRHSSISSNDTIGSTQSTPSLQRIRSPQSIPGLPRMSRSAFIPFGQSSSISSSHQQPVSGQTGSQSTAQAASSQSDRSGPGGFQSSSMPPFVSGQTASQ
eukprot:493187_1